MSVVLENTNAGAVSLAISAERFAQGSSTVGRVLTLVIVADEATETDAIRAAVLAAREHPCRILGAIPRPGRGAPRLDASITVGGTDGLGEVVELRLRGALAHHAESVVLPLLVPDAPVVVWWPGKGPEVPADDPVGRLAQRRITDAAAATRPMAALEERRDSYRQGDTDLAWTRLTPWRAQLAAALDQPYDRLTGATVHIQRSNPSGPLLAAWLHHTLRIPVSLVASRGPGLTAVRLHTTNGDLAIQRPDGAVATVSRPGFPDREAALARRSPSDLVAEELRRLDPDEIYGETLATLSAWDPRAGTFGARPASRTVRKPAARKAAAKTAANRKAAAKKSAARKAAPPAQKRTQKAARRRASS